MQANGEGMEEEGRRWIGKGGQRLERRGTGQNGDKLKTSGRIGPWIQQVQDQRKCSHQSLPPPFASFNPHTPSKLSPSRMVTRGYVTWCRFFGGNGEQAIKSHKIKTNGSSMGEA